LIRGNRASALQEESLEPLIRSQTLHLMLEMFVLTIMVSTSRKNRHFMWVG